MRLLLVSDAYLPSRTSCAVQMHDLAREAKAQGHEPTVLVPEPGLDRPWRLDDIDGVQVLRARAARTKDVGLARRALAEALLPWSLWRGLRRSPLREQRWDGVAWYSPSIFFGPLVRRVQRRHGCRGYLILRDLFPDWAVDAGLMRRGFAYRVFKGVERYQYRVADVIGVQTPANLPLVRREVPAARLEVLNNWLARDDRADRAAVLEREPLRGRTVFAYTGNMGAAQGMDCLLDLAAALRDDARAAFLFVGRGSDVPRLRERVRAEGLDNVVILDEVEPAEVNAILRGSHVGLLALDPAHTTHNIPGKFVAYLRAGLPTLARINAGNDLQAVIEAEGVGRCIAGDDPAALQRHARELLDSAALRAEMGARAGVLAARAYSAGAAVRQIAAALQSGASE